MRTGLDSTVISGNPGGCEHQRLASSPAAAHRATTPVKAKSSSAHPSVTAAVTTPGARPSPTAIPVRDMTPVSAVAFGPGGTSDGDNPQGASLALSGNPATSRPSPSR
jgi:hypothetical protein